MAQKEKQEIEEEQLKAVTGGSSPVISTSTSATVEDTQIFGMDDKQNPIRWRVTRGRPATMAMEYHYACPRCGRILHEGFMGRMFCDPCDESWFKMSLTKQVDIPWHPVSRHER